MSASVITWALTGDFFELLGKEAFLKRWVVVLQVLRHPLAQRTIPKVIEDAVFERVIENGILLLLIANLRHSVRNEGIVLPFARTAKDIGHLFFLKFLREV